VKALLLIVVASLPVLAQVTPAPRRSVRASGEADVAVSPDQVRVTVSVVTRATTADEAASQNAARSSAVTQALRSLLGNTGEIRTAFYSLRQVREGNPPRDAGFEASNTLYVRANNVALAGRIIDTATDAGATRIDGISVGLRDDEPTRLQALRAAGQVARARAEAVAAGIGVRLGAVLTADAGGAVVVPTNRIAAPSPAGAATVIEPGTLNVTAVVSVEYEILP
jgi:uncharacterized protein YggE